jgi:ribosome biogenesis GTPase
MSAKRRKNSREQDITGRYHSGDFDEDHADTKQRFSHRSKTAQQDKILRTAAMRAAAEGIAGSAAAADVESLRVGQVIQVHSLFSEVQHEGRVWLCVTRKTLTRVADTQIVVGDRVRFRESGTKDELGRPEAVIEHIVPRATILSRTESFKGVDQHPIVANADQMLIVASLLHPEVKWGLIDRMIIAAQAGKLQPIICLNKLDLAAGPEGPNILRDAEQALDHYEWLGVHTLPASVENRAGLEELKTLLKDRITVVTGHSGVGKSSLIQAIQPTLDIRIGEVSEYTTKGRHTTTSARWYPLDFGGAVVDTPGVKVFGLWGVTRENLRAYFPDMVNGSAPAWRKESFNRILESLPA